MEKDDECGNGVRWDAKYGVRKKKEEHWFLFLCLGNRKKTGNTAMIEAVCVVECFLWGQERYLDWPTSARSISVKLLSVWSVSKMPPCSPVTEIRAAEECSLEGWTQNKYEVTLLSQMMSTLCTPRLRLHKQKGGFVSFCKELCTIQTGTCQPAAYLPIYKKVPVSGLI